jgi:hypothetical protein
MCKGCTAGTYCTVFLYTRQVGPSPIISGAAKNAGATYQVCSCIPWYNLYSFALHRVCRAITKDRHGRPHVELCTIVRKLQLCSTSGKPARCTSGEMGTILNPVGVLSGSDFCSHVAPRSDFMSVSV